MLPRILQLHPSTYQRLVRLSKEAERDGAYRVAKRLQAVVLNSQGRSSGELAEILQAPRSKVSEWLARYQTDGVEGLLEGQRSGRPAQLSQMQRQQLGNILDSGSVAYGLGGVWTSQMIAWVVEEEFGVHYHPGHVRKLLHEMGFSGQRPQRVSARADRVQQDRWHRRTYPNLKKKSQHRRLALIFSDEANFCQDSTLHAAWSRIAQPPQNPVTGQHRHRFHRIEQAVTLVEISRSTQQSELSIQSAQHSGAVSTFILSSQVTVDFQGCELVATVRLL